MGRTLLPVTKGYLVRTCGWQMNEHAYRLDELRRVYPELVLEPPMPDRTAMGAAQGAAAPITALRSAGAKDLTALFTELAANIEEGLS